MTTLSPAEVVFAYHRRTKHRFAAYAAGPATLDWESQPTPFRRFAGAPVIRLPLAADAAPSLQALLEKPWHAGPERTIAEISIESIGALLNLSFGITAWKSYGPDRWALRANPSSGNLHPLEAYLMVAGIAGLPDGVYHYCPDDHVLECRASFTAATGSPLLCIGLSSLMWREAWKYGERAFRYCQLDAGHGAAALAYAASALGWALTERRELSTRTLASLLGTDREADFPAGRHADAEREEAEILLQLADGDTLPAFDPAALLAGARWQGSASSIDPAPLYRWPIIDEVATATRREGNAQGMLPAIPAHAMPPVAEPSAGPTLGAVILGRRSAQRFDPRATLAAHDFFALLAATMPGDRAPWRAFDQEPRISLALFVHRVAGIQPGLYLLPRKVEHLAALAGRFQPEAIAATPDELPLYRLAVSEPQELRRLARAIHCHQDLAADACFALGMLAEFSAPIAGHPEAYRALYREAGMIGQALYLESEALGLRGTGIGCFFDDPFHEVLGLADETFQSLYHFTVGLPVHDTRIETSPAYPDR